MSDLVRRCGQEVRSPVRACTGQCLRWRRFWLLGTLLLLRCPNDVSVRLPLTVRIGLALILVGAAGFGGWVWWVLTRTWMWADDALLSWLCVLCVGTGTSLLVIAGIGRFQKAWPAVAPCVPPGTVGRHDRWKPRPPHRRIFSGMPSFGLMAGTICVSIFLPTWLLHVWLFPTPTGLRVHLPKAGAVAHSSPGMEPLLVRVDFAGRGARPNLYLNSQPISWEDLPTALAKELNRRPPHFPAYV